MERFKRLFSEAKRIKPNEAMWQRIAAQADLSSADRAAGGGYGYGWRLAASMAIGLGVLAAMLTVISDPKGKDAKAQGTRDSVALASAAAAKGDGNLLVDDELLLWHADLGEASEADWEIDPMLSDPTLDE